MDYFMEIVRQKKSKKSNKSDADDNAPPDFDRPEDELSHFLNSGLQLIYTIFDMKL